MTKASPNLVHSKDDHRKALVIIDQLIDVVGDDEDHPLAELLDYFGAQVEAYENEHVHIPEAEPREVLRFLMQQRGLKKADLTACTPQGRICDILSGKRDISKAVARKLAAYFQVSAEVFL